MVLTNFAENMPVMNKKDKTAVFINYKPPCDVLPEFKKIAKEAAKQKGKRYETTVIASVLTLLMQNEGNVYKTAKQTGINRKMVEYWSRRQGMEKKIRITETDKKLQAAAIMPSEVKTPENRRTTEEAELAKTVQSKKILDLRGEVVDRLRDLVKTCTSVQNLAKLFEVVDKSIKEEGGKEAPPPQNNLLAIMSQSIQYLNNKSEEIPSELITPEEGEEDGTDD